MAEMQMQGFDDGPMRGAVEAKRSAPIGMAMDQLDSEISMLTEEVSMLIERIVGVTGPPMPEPGEVAAKPDPENSCSNVAQFLHHEGQNIRNLRFRVKNIRERIEL